MKYYSTNGKSPKVSLKDAVASGYAPDMGLYLPEQIPTLPGAFIRNMQSMSLHEISYAVANTLFGSDVPAETLRDIVYSTMNFEIPLQHVHGNIFSLELFHGPTLTFKDVGTRFLARIMSGLLGDAGSGNPVNILTATSGGSGGAIANGFFNVPGVHVYILYPHNKLSKSTEAQFCTLGGNITPIEVQGTYNDCQDLVSQAFSDHELMAKMRLTSANSINIARLLPQTFYYFHAYAQLAARLGNNVKLTVSVPCGNLGNLVSAIISKRMGLPINRIIAATDTNCDLTRYFSSGTHISSDYYPTITPAMDVCQPNNLPRLLPLFGNDIEVLRATVNPQVVTEPEISAAIKNVYADYGYILNPHSAAAYQALASSMNPGEVGIFTATAHPAKAKRTLESILGIEIKEPECLVTALKGKKSSVKMAPVFSQIKRFMLGQIHK